MNPESTNTVTSLDDEIMARVKRLDVPGKRQVLALLDDIAPENEANQQYFSAIELMKLPPEQREKLVNEAFERAAGDQFELFEADEVFDDDAYIIEPDITDER